jgi:hypothetical protein
MQSERVFFSNKPCVRKEARGGKENGEAKSEFFKNFAALVTSHLVGGVFLYF